MSAQRIQKPKLCRATAAARELRRRGLDEAEPRQLVALAKKGILPSKMTADGLTLFDPPKVEGPYRAYTAARAALRRSCP